MEKNPSSQQRCTVSGKEQEKRLRAPEKWLFGESPEKRFESYVTLFKLITKFRRLEGHGSAGISNNLLDSRSDLAVAAALALRAASKEHAELAAKSGNRNSFSRLK